MYDFCVIGSGFSGSTVSNLLSKKYKVCLIDKGRGPGGRSSNRRLKKNLSFDHGLQYLSPKSKKFKNFLNKLFKKKVIKVWEGNHLDFTFKKKVFDNKYVGRKSNNDPIKYQIKGINQVYSTTIKRIKYKNFFWEILSADDSIYRSKSLIITCPFPQLKKIAKKYLSRKILNLNVKMQPNITVMLGIKNKSNHEISSIKFDDDVLSWAANENSKKRFKTNYDLWTLQASSKWSKLNINNFKKNSSAKNYLISKFLSMTGIKKQKIFFKSIHGWRYSYNYEKTSFLSFWNKKISLGVCGDWLSGPKAENAYLSAVDLYEKIKKNPL